MDGQTQTPAVSANGKPARVRYTQMRIKGAFLACLAEKRKHCADPFDRLKRLEEDALEWIEKISAIICINRMHLPKLSA